MSEETMESHGTKPLPEHEWLKGLVGKWNVVSEMTDPSGQMMTAEGTETVTMLGPLWAVGEGKSSTFGGEMNYRTGLGYDVSFKEYRGFWMADMSSHLWKYVGELSSDGRVMTLNCEGPHMQRDGETANYRDVIEWIDENHRTLTSYGQDEAGNWTQFMKASYTRM